MRSIQTQNGLIHLNEVMVSAENSSPMLQIAQVAIQSRSIGQIMHNRNLLQGSGFTIHYANVRLN
jgi:hypothetical protein